jgi:Rrf2 family transcriptional regulator, nitric oxide-sensitive transcriptional repressor
MRLTRYTDYALRVLIYLALHAERLCTIPEIANAYGISQNHLTKVAHDLGKAGLVESARGRLGGLRLAKPAAMISVGAVVRVMEGEGCMADCDTCVIVPACSLAQALDTAREAFMASLDAVTLASVARRGGALRRLLNVA